MHDIKIIRDDPDNFLKKILLRNEKVDLKDLLLLDKKNREIIQKKEKLEQEKKTIAKKIDKAQFKKSKDISTEISELQNTQTSIRKHLYSQMGQ